MVPLKATDAYVFPIFTHNDSQNVSVFRQEQLKTDELWVEVFYQLEVVSKIIREQIGRLHYSPTY